MKRNFETTMPGDSPNRKVTLVERNPAPNGIPLVSSIAVAKKQPNDLVELAMQIQKADEFMYSNACSKLAIIAEQISFLKKQANQVLLETKQNTELHHAACNFKKVPGHVYYLYERPSGQKYFSMLSPKEWTPAHEFLGGYRLEADQSWTPEENINIKNQQLETLNNVMNNTSVENCYLSLDAPMEH